MFRGTAAAKIDEKGRLKLPSRFIDVIPESYGKRFFVTSLNGECARIFPLESWRQIEAKLAAAPSTNKAIQRYKRNLNFYGAEVEVDGADRLVIPAHLRERAGVNGEVFVVGYNDYLEVWNRSHFDREMQDDPLTDEDLNTLATFGI